MKRWNYEFSPFYVSISNFMTENGYGGFMHLLSRWNSRYSLLYLLW